MTDVRLTVTAALAVIASAVTLAPAFQSASFLWPCAGAVIVVAAAGWAARRGGLPRVLSLPVTLAALVGYLTLLHARPEAVLGVLPGPAAWAELRAFFEAGVTDIHRFAAPVRAYPSIVGLTTAGVGLVAVAVDTLAVSYRRPALAGLPLLVLYCVPAGVVRDGVGWLPFVVGAAGFLALLLADGSERVRRWGRPLARSVGGRTVAHRQAGDVDTTALHQVGRRVGAAALGVAVVVPALLPSFDAGVFGWGGRGFGSGDGSRTINVVNPIVDLRRDLVRRENTALIRYTTGDPAPGYLRMATLDTFTGESWVPARLKATDDQDVENGLPAPPGLSKEIRRQAHEWTIEIGDTLRDVRLPLPYPTIEVAADGQWLYDGPTRNVFSYRNDTRGLVYEVVSLDLDYQPIRLRDAPSAASIGGTSAYTDLPDDLPPLVRRKTAELTVTARSDYDAALAIQQWLRTEFSYSLAVEPGNSSSALVDFLTDRSGYCEQFAATMAIMARVAGIPSRVNVGFTQGSRRGARTWAVSSQDAHAWPELYFSGVGWVPFEPTPRTDGSTPPPSYADADDLPATATGGPGGPGPGGSNLSGNPRSSNELSTPRSRELLRRGLSGIPSGRTGPVTGEKDSGRGALPVLIGLAALVLALSPMTIRQVRRRDRWRRLDGTARGVRAAWSELCDTAWDFGVPPFPEQTPRQLAARLRASGLERAADSALTRLVGAYERSRFATRIGPVEDLRSDLTAVRRGLAAQAGRRARLRAALVPPSTRSALSWVAERVADVLDLADAAVARARAFVRSGVARLAGRRSLGEG